jgi:PAS domain S-box-containing protein
MQMTQKTETETKSIISFLSYQIIGSIIYASLILLWSKYSAHNNQDELLIFLLPPVFYAAVKFNSRIYLLSLFSGLAISLFAISNLDVVFSNSFITVIIIILVTILSSEFIIKLKKACNKERNDSQKKISTIVDSAVDLIFTKNRQGEYTLVNQAFMDLFGLSRNELIGKTDWDIFTKENANHIQKVDNKVWDGEIVKGSDTITVKDTEYTFQVTKVPLYDDNGVVSSLCGIARDVSTQQRLEDEREKLIAELQEALANVRQLNGLLPICSGCKKIRDDKGYWNQVEIYIRKHSEAEFTHSMCPDCVKQYYPDLHEEMCDKDNACEINEGPCECQKSTN